MTIHLPEELERYVQAKVLSGHFASEDEAISAAVRLLRQTEATHQQSNIVPAATVARSSMHEPTWQRVVDEVKAIPDQLFECIPSDGSEQLDHYLYATPKRPVT